MQGGGTRARTGGLAHTVSPSLGALADTGRTNAAKGIHENLENLERTGLRTRQACSMHVPRQSGWYNLGATRGPQMTRDAADPDARHARGMHAEGDDWSKLPNSQRKDRPLSSAQLKELAAKSNGKGFVALAGNCSLILATGGAIMLTDGVLVPALWRQAWPPLLLLLLLLWQGFLLSALGFAAQHECLHYTAFRTKSLNSLVGRLVSVPSFSFFLHEQAMHKEHHTYTQDLERDAELVAEVAGCTYSGAASGLPDGVDLAAVAAAGRDAS